MSGSRLAEVEVALNQAENMLNALRVFKNLENALRVLRDGLKELPMIEERLPKLRQEEAQVQAKIASGREDLSGLSSQRLEMEKMATTTHRLREEATALNQEVARNRDRNQALAAEHVTLEAQVKAMKSELADAKNRMARMLDG